MSKFLSSLSVAQVEEVIRLANVWAKSEEGNDSLESGEELELNSLSNPNPHHMALTEAVEKLPQASRNELLALMWLGRADAGETVEDWAELVEHACQEKDASVEVITGKLPLGSYLETGLGKIEVAASTAQ